MRREATPPHKAIDNRTQQSSDNSNADRSDNKMGFYHPSPEEDEDADEGLAGEVGAGGEDVQLQGDSSRADLNTLKAVNTPIPRIRTTGAIRPPDYFRTQYLSNLGIWATKQAKHLNSAPRTEARYKSNLG